MTSEEFLDRSKKEELVGITFDKKWPANGGYRACISKRPVQHVSGLLTEAAMLLQNDRVSEAPGTIKTQSKENFAEAVVSVANEMTDLLPAVDWAPTHRFVSMKKKEFEGALNGGATLFKAWPYVVGWSNARTRG